MQTFLPGTNITLTIPLVDSAGSALSVTGVEWRLVNGAGTELVARGTLSGYLAGDQEAVVVVPLAYNALDVGVGSDVRSVELFVQTETGLVSLTSTYRLALSDPLTVPTTSFMTYARATMIAAEVPGLTGWSAASKDEQIAALQEAKLRIARLKFRYRYWDSMWQSRVEPTLVVGDLDLITLSEFNSLPVDFKIALERAQVIEANHILGGDAISKRREDGLMSETIGESSMMFRPGRPLRLPLCDRAMRTLSKYIESGRMLVRA